MTETSSREMEKAYRARSARSRAARYFLIYINDLRNDATAVRRLRSK
jgi:hypothetical protein